MNRYKCLSQPTYQRELSDCLLVERACSGDDAAFATLVQRYQRQIYQFVCTLLDADEANDVMQFVWVQFYRCLPILQSNAPMGWSEASLKPWLLRVARNRCLDELRRRRRHPQFFFSALEDAGEEECLTALLDPRPLPEEQAERRDEQKRLCAAIQTLSPTARAVVWLRYTEDLPFSAIGCRLQMPSATAKAAFYRACTKLRMALSPRREGVPPPSVATHERPAGSQ